MKVISQKFGNNWACYNGDCIEIMKGISDNSIHYSLFSPPFASLFTYSDSDRDMGNAKDYNEFAEQFKYLITDLFRVIMPGRLVSIHCMDLLATIGHDGYIGLKDFPGLMIKMFQNAGFIYHSRVCIWKDPLVQAVRTKALGLAHKQISKDSSRCNMGLPDYIVTMRKPGDNPEPIAHGRGFEKYIGDMPEPKGIKSDNARTNKYSHEVWQRYASPVWFDINQTRTLNVQAARSENDEKHICIARNSLVLTRNGYKSIQNITVGEKVLTHLGRWRSVMAVQNTGVQPVVEMHAQGVPGLTLTPDHKVWSRVVRQSPWAQSHSRDDAKNNETLWTQAMDMVGNYVNFKLPKVENKDVNNDVQYWWIIGRWLADGHIHKERDALYISCGKHEFNSLMDKLGIYAGCHNDIGTAIQIRLNDRKRQFRNIIMDCGKYAYGKHIPSCAYTMPENLSKALLDGYLSGDGHYMADRNRWTASSVSKKLLLGMAMLAQRAYGAIASIYKGRPAGTRVIQGRTVNTKQDWIFSFDIPDKSRQKGLPFIVNDGAWKKVKSVENIGNIETWNLRIDEDESFTVEGCIVKNCPLQLDTIARCLDLWSNKEDTVLSPFAGVGSEGYEAIQRDRNFIGIELKESYYNQMIKNLERFDKSYKQQDLFN